MASRSPHKPAVQHASPRRLHATRASSPAEHAHGARFASPPTTHATSHPLQVQQLRDAGASASVPLSASLLAFSSTAHSGSNDNGTTTTMTRSSSRGTPNPHVEAIQSRVADLMRRYDESVADDTSDDDDVPTSAPAHWRVGDVLIATHSALTTAGEYTERSIDTEFGEDPDVAAALGDGEHILASVIEHAAQRTQHVQQMLMRTLAMVQQLQRSSEQQRVGDTHTASESSSQLRELRAALETQQKEKAGVLAQLQDHVRSHRELLATFDEQHQELKRAQIAEAMKTDEMKTRSDDFDRRLLDAQHALDTSQQSVSAWRDKLQMSDKSRAASDARVTELEHKVTEQAEELVKHAVVLQAKMQDDKHKERVRDSEIMRLRAALSAATQAESSKSKRSEGTSETQREGLRVKLQQSDAVVRALQTQLANEQQIVQQIERDKDELVRHVAALEAQVASTPMTAGSSIGVLTKATSFALSLRAFVRPPRDKNDGATEATTKTNIADKDDDLSTASDDDDDDAETTAAEQALTATVQHVVASVFPQRQHRESACEQMDEHITQHIAQIENPTATTTASIVNRHDTVEASSDKQRQHPDSSSVIAPIAAATRPQSSSPPALAAPTVVVAVETAPSPSSPPSLSPAPMSDVERMKLACDDELARMKQQYVTSLLEYKRLVIEQYERRQAQLHEQHRVEVENLILLVQDKFKREVAKHTDKMQRAKESLKLLYRTIVVDRTTGSASPSTATDSSRNAASTDEPVPLKALLRAAVFAMSTSTKRAAVATTEIQQICERVKRTNESRNSTASVRVPGNERLPSRVHVACQVNDADLAPLRNASNARSTAVAPECTNSGGLLADGDGSRNQQHARATGKRCPHAQPCHRCDEEYALYLVEGAALSRAVVAELRALQPTLPVGAYYLSSTLRHTLLLELLQFYMTLSDAERGLRTEQQPRLPMLGATAASSSSRDSNDVEVYIGSPRDTPFMRRKALESVQRQHVQRRRQMLATSGESIVRSAAPSSPSSHSYAVAWPSPRSPSMSPRSP